MNKITFFFITLGFWDFQYLQLKELILIFSKLHIEIQGSNINKIKTSLKLQKKKKKDKY